ncbi:MAG: hypothetical protein ACON37_06565 [Candidatus Puniceispirillaceae bacterium]
MATVRQSITALYEESRKSAVDGAPMMAVIDTVPVADLALVADLGLDVAPDTPRQPAIVARFDELRRLAEVEARQEKTGQDKTAQDKTRQDDQPLDDDLAGTFDTGLSAIDPAAIGQDNIDTAAPETQILPSAPLEMSQAAEPALPEEPPAPDRGAGADLEIGDIQELVRQAWEDEAGIGKTDTRHQPVAADPEASHPEANGPAAVAAAATDMAPPVPTDIEMAMEEIAAAVVQSGDSTTPVDVAAMKAEIIAAMRSEMKTLLEAGLTSAVRTAVAEAVSEAVTNALADMPHTADAAGTAKAASGDAPPAKAKAKTAAKKAPATRKAAAKKTAAKKAAVVKKLRADPTPDPDEA